MTWREISRPKLFGSSDWGNHFRKVKPGKPMEELTETNKDKRHALNIVKYVPTETASKTFWNFKG